MQLSKNVQVSVTAGSEGSAGTDVTGTAIDTAGFQGVMFVAEIATANAANILKVEQSDASGSGFTALTGATAVAAADGDLAVVDVKSPTKRYVRAVIDRSGAATATGPIVAHAYGPADAPVAHPSTTIATAVVSPAEA